ncbi:MAG: hypothetical protein J6M90_03205 [Oscillospiraceae bacterium]|jgi:glutamyl-tRNA reductase|nr:hypothetical protein [Oscillospiraceae bacterium]MBQ4256043.1 hypothetical protein [Oscillospiraceae bacterium]MBQ9208480.1 hypothetical protein [Oscillospiraceae bacterium]MBR4346708.1 hypothetical protein [Oscillospiraceae bacterium]
MAEIMIEDYLDRIVDILAAAKPVPLSFNGNKAVDVDAIQDAVDNIRANMPDDLRQAKKIVQERKYIMDTTNEKAEQIITEAEKKAAALTDEHTITENARKKAAEIEKQANNQAAQIKAAVDDYIIKLLAKAEQQINGIAAGTDQVLSDNEAQLRRARQSTDNQMKEYLSQLATMKNALKNPAK